MFIGKTLFLIYFLVRLLQLKQVVLFTLDGERLYLFYHGRVYTTYIPQLNAIQPELQLPEPKTSKVFIWSLFDVREKQEPKQLLFKPPCIPVQTASPDPIRFKMWVRDRDPLRVGLPLWTREELAQAYVVPISCLYPYLNILYTLRSLPYQPMYNLLSSALRKDPSQCDIDPLTPFPGSRVLLDEFQQDGISLSPEEALDYLLGAAINRFGYSARGVFRGVFRYHSSTKTHQAACNITLKALEAAISALAENESTPKTSHLILTISPVYHNPLDHDDWKMRFLSDWVAKYVIQQLRIKNDRAIRRQLSSLQRIPQAGGLMGYFFEPFIHRLLSEETDGRWPLFSMSDDKTNSPRFVIDRSVTPNIQFPKINRRVVSFDSIADLTGDLKNIYYIPMASDFPLLDAFIIEIDNSRRTAILWVIQITTSRSHGGSALGYQKIRGIIASLKERLGKQPPTKKKKPDTGKSVPTVEVRYLLVVPTGKSGNFEWRFPKGWNDNCVRNDHRGKVYSLEVSLA